MKDPMVKVARLDHDQVYWGLEERRLADVKPGELVFCSPEIRARLPEGSRWVDVGCDLPGGQQKWSAEKGSFEPLPRSQRKAAPEAPTFEQALYDFLVVQPAAKIPTRTAAWMKHMEHTLDERGATKGRR